jgi:hypothetical protein
MTFWNHHGSPQIRRAGRTARKRSRKLQKKKLDIISDIELNCGAKVVSRRTL